MRKKLLGELEISLYLYVVVHTHGVYKLPHLTNGLINHAYLDLGHWFWSEAHAYPVQHMSKAGGPGPGGPTSSLLALPSRFLQRDVWKIENSFDQISNWVFPIFIRSLFVCNLH
jgi:hypothetical protein